MTKVRRFWKKNQELLYITSKLITITIIIITFCITLGTNITMWEI